MPRFTQETALIAIELQQIVSEFAHEIDFNNALNLADFYAEDGSFAVGDFVYTGHEAIRKFYVDRLVRVRAQHKDGIRVSCHTFVNMRVAVQDKDNATVYFTNVNYAGEGHPPVHATITPAMVTDCSMVFRREKDGNWRIVTFSGTPLMAGDDPFTKKALLKS
jgi:ketosteroid isomerase-like protein